MVKGLGLLFIISSALGFDSLWAQDLPFVFGKAAHFNSISGDATTAGGPVNVTESRLGLSANLFKTEKHAANLSFRGQRLELGETLVIPDRKLALPKDFGSADLGFNYTYFGSAKVTRGISASFGTSGRRLLDSSNSRFININYFSEKKRENGDSWFFFLSYSNNRANFNNIPLPGFAYSMNGETYRAFLGAPFISLVYFPKPFTFLTVLSPFFANLEASYSILGPWQSVAGWSWIPRAFQNIAPAVDDEQLLYVKREWYTGLRWGFGPFINASLFYVYEDDRELFIGQSAGRKSSSTIKLPEAGGVQLRFRMSF